MTTQNIRHAKITLLLAASLLFTVIAALRLSFGPDAKEGASGNPSFYVQLTTTTSLLEGAQARVNVWKNEKDGNYYLFLPSGAVNKPSFIYLEDTASLKIGGLEYQSGSPFPLAPGEYAFRYGDGPAGTLVIMHSANLGSVFVETQSGGLTALRNDKDYREAGASMFLDANANIVHRGPLKYMTGRGNSSWYYEKASYRLKLERKANLFDMGAAVNWVMIPNAEDPSMLRNAAAYTWAERTGLAYSPEYRVVDWYINGDYWGTYLLAERIEVGGERVNIRDLDQEAALLNNQEDLSQFGRLKYIENKMDKIRWYDIPVNPGDITGGYLLEQEVSTRYDGNLESIGFVSDKNKRIVIKSPQYASQEEVSYIGSLYKEMEAALFAEDGYNPETGRYYTDYIDLESFVKKYLIEEITKNLDAATTSQYFYKPPDSVSTKLFAGPVWDYDKALGNGGMRDDIDLNDPEDLYAAVSPGKGVLWRGLYSQPDFYEAMRDMYYGTFLTSLPGMNRMIEESRDQMLPSAVMNAYRWNVFPEASTKDEVESAYCSAVSEMQDFLNSRCHWLAEYWN